jgi:hypothetical protein
MAQSRQEKWTAIGGGSGRGHTRGGTHDTLGYGHEMDPLGQYYASNEEVLQHDPVLSTIFRMISSRLFSGGLIFMHKEKRLVPHEDFTSLVRHFWIPFAYKALAFMWENKFLVWFTYAPRPGVLVPAVPDRRQVGVQLGYDELTGAPALSAWWHNRVTVSQLYTFKDGLPGGVSPGHSASLVDRAKPLLAMLYKLTESREVAAYYAAQPPIVLQHHNQGNPTTQPGVDGMQSDDVYERHIRDKMKSLGRDNINVQRIQRLSGGQLQTYKGRTQAEEPRPPCMHTEELIARPLTDNYLYVPQGLQVASGANITPDADYLAVRERLIMEINMLFGVPPLFSMPTKGSDNVAGVKVHESSFLFPLQEYWSVFSVLMTDVFRIIHDQGSIRVGDTKATAADEKKRVAADDSKAFTAAGIFAQSRETNGTYAKGDITVRLRSEFNTDVEKVKDLFDDGIVAHDTMQWLMLGSLGLDQGLADKTVKEPMRLNALTQKQMKEFNTKPESATTKKPTPKSKSKSSASKKKSSSK